MSGVYPNHHSSERARRGFRPEIVAAILLGIGVACFAGAWLVRRQQTALFVDRPEASGEVGFVSVYVQQPHGPVRLQPSRLRVVRRPQDVAFQLSSKGAGPRGVRIEMESAGRRSVLHEQKIEVPADQAMIDYVLALGDDVPDELTLHVHLEAPHAMGYDWSYPLRLVGSAKTATSTRAP